MRPLLFPSRGDKVLLSPSSYSSSSSLLPSCSVGCWRISQMCLDVVGLGEGRNGYDNLPSPTWCGCLAGCHLCWVGRLSRNLYLPVPRAGGYIIQNRCRGRGFGYNSLSCDLHHGCV